MLNPDLFSDDILDFVEQLNKFEVKFVIVGGIAVIYHGYTRGTGDVDFFYGISEENTSRMFEALREFWKGDIPAISCPGDLRQPGQVIQFGRPPNRIDLINSIDGVTFEEVWSNSLVEHIDVDYDLTIRLISRDKLIQNKQASGRPQDEQDLLNLEEESPD